MKSFPDITRNPRVHCVVKSMLLSYAKQINVTTFLMENGLYVVTVIVIFLFCL